MTRQQVIEAWMEAASCWREVGDVSKEMYCQRHADYWSMPWFVRIFWRLRSNPVDFKVGEQRRQKWAQYSGPA